MNQHSRAPIRVVLGAVPLALLVETYSYVDGLLRELGLIRLGQHQGVGSTDRGAEILDSIHGILAAYEHERASLRQQAERAVERGTGLLELSFEMPPETIEGARTLLGLLDEVWALSASGAFLTLPPSMEACRFQRRLLKEILRSTGVSWSEASEADPVATDRSLVETVDPLETDRSLVERIGPMPVPLPGAHVHETVLSSGAEAAQQARRVVTRVLSGCDAEALVDMAQLVVSELVTNTLLHAGSRPRLRLWCTFERVRLEVCDDKLALPAPHHAGPDSVTGRGLGLVDAVSEDWGAYLRPGGKCVWVDLRRQMSTLEAEGAWSIGLSRHMAAHAQP